MHLTIEKIISRGYGLAHTEEGQAVFVPFTLPDEIHDVNILQKRKGWLLGESTKLIKSSSHRVDPKCIYYGKCGGCQFQHIEYSKQLEYKKEIFNDNWQRLGKNPFIESEITASPQPWAYRNRFQFHSDNKGQPCFKLHNSNDLIDINNCPVAVTGINSFLRSGKLLENPGRNSFFSPDGIHIFNAYSPYDCEVVLQSGVYKTHASLFFQSNVSILDQFLMYIEDNLPEKSKGTACDLYCGVGLFSQVLSRHFSHVIANEASVDVEKYYAMNCPDNCNLLTGPIEKQINNLRKENPELVIVDPPRKGMSARALDLLIQLNPQRIIYVSCDSSTLSRDCSKLIQGRYKPVKANLFDFYPQTYHFESVIVLDRKK